MFDKRKVSNISELKNEFKQMMYENGELTDSSEKVFNAIWGNRNLSRSLFGDIDDVDDAKNELENNISKTSNTFYNFIKVK